MPRPLLISWPTRDRQQVPSLELNQDNIDTILIALESFASRVDATTRQEVNDLIDHVMARRDIFDSSRLPPETIEELEPMAMQDNVKLEVQPTANGFSISVNLVQ